MKSKNSLNVMYCYDQMYPLLGNDIDPTEYPYMMVIALHDNRSTEFVENPISIKKDSSFYTNGDGISPTEFGLMNITGSNSKTDVIPLKDVKPKIYKTLDDSFKRGDMMTDIFRVNLSNVRVHDEDHYSMREHVNSIESPNDEKYLYSTRAEGLDLDKNHRLRSVGRGIFQTDDKYTNNDNALIFDPRGYYDYMFDKRLEKRVKKDIEQEALKVCPVYTSHQHTNLNSATITISNHFFAHVLVFKTRSKMEDYGQYFLKKYDRDGHFGIHSSVDDPVNNRIRRLKSLSKDLNITAGRVSNKTKSYEVKFDWDYVICEDMYDDIIKEIDEGTFYTDKKIGKNKQNLETAPIYIDEEKFINKMKLQSKWKRCINTIVVNDQ